MDEFADEAGREANRARSALDDARVLFDGGGTDGGVINRLYYAAFHAAQAALYSRGENPSSHGHVRQLFGQHIVLEGDASRKDGRLLSMLYDYRWEADYGGDDLDVDVEEFVDLMIVLVSSK